MICKAADTGVLDHVVVHKGSKPTAVNGFITEPLTVGNVTLEPVWKASMVLAPPDLALEVIEGEEVLMGSP